MAILGVILNYVLPVLTALPQLVVAVEGLWSTVPKSGTHKWIAVEQAISQSVAAAAEAIAKTVPNAKVDTISTAVAVLTKTVNDGFVKFLNDIGYFTTSGS